MSNSLSTLRLEGADPRAWGHQHGETFRSQIRELAEIRLALLSDWFRDCPNSFLDQLCEDHLTSLQSKWPKALAELEGISNASGVSLRDLIVLNAYTDLKDFRSEMTKPAEGGCSAIAAKGPDVNFSAQNWDMHASAQPFVMLLEIPHATRPVKVLTITGCLGLNGVNADGVAVMINNLTCNETNRRGLIWPALVRLVLEQSTARGAMDTLTSNLPSSGHNYLISDRDEAFNVETTGLHHDLTASISRESTGYIGHTNHYVGSLKSQERTAEISPSTLPRMEAVQRFFDEHPIDKMTGETIYRDFFQEGPLCQCISRPGDAADPHAVKTCGALAVDYQSGKAFALRGRYGESPVIEWNYAT